MAGKDLRLSVSHQEDLLDAEPPPIAVGARLEGHDHSLFEHAGGVGDHPGLLVERRTDAVTRVVWVRAAAFRDHLSRSRIDVGGGGAGPTHRHGLLERGPSDIVRSSHLGKRFAH